MKHKIGVMAKEAKRVKRCHLSNCYTSTAAQYFLRPSVMPNEPDNNDDDDNYYYNKLQETFATG